MGATGRKFILSADRREEFLAVGIQGVHPNFGDRDAVWPAMQQVRSLRVDVRNPPREPVGIDSSTPPRQGGTLEADGAALPTPFLALDQYQPPIGRCFPREGEANQF
jgi:hypothetical protein